MNGFDPNKHHRYSIRLRDWDYRSPGLYFVTICTFGRQNLFANEEFRDVAVQALARISQQKHTRHVMVDESIVMPNHDHIIFDFTGFAPQADMTHPTGNFENALAGSLGVVVGRYKTAVTTRINNLRRSKGSPVWQRGYYERIIRNERELQATRQYIINNPARWAEDRDNLDALLAKMTYHPVGAGRRGRHPDGSYGICPAPSRPTTQRPGKQGETGGDKVLVNGKGMARLSRPNKRRRGPIDRMMTELNEALVA